MGLQISHHTFLIGRQSQDEFEEPLSQLGTGEVHLEIVRILMYIKEEAAIVSLVQADNTKTKDNQKPLNALGVQKSSKQ